MCPVLIQTQSHWVKAKGLYYTGELQGLWIALELELDCNFCSQNFYSVDRAEPSGEDIFSIKATNERLTAAPYKMNVKTIFKIR